MNVSDRRLGQTHQLGGGERKKYLNLETPEGVTLQFQIPKLGARMGAFIIDYIWLMLGIFVCWLVGLSLLQFLPAQLVITVIILVTFAIRQGYFIFFELRSQGSTPGKRNANLKVIDRAGQPLTSQAIFLRNLLREVEFMIPIGFLFQTKDVTSLETWLAALFCLWVFLFPCFNRQHLRIGDLVANTIVVEVPKSMLAVDLSDHAAITGSSQARFSFTREQLDIYGIYELQQLEDVLRRSGNLSPVALNSLYQVIVNKIGWPFEQRSLDPMIQREFLRAFYAAQRQELERRMHLGERREFKRG